MKDASSLMLIKIQRLDPEMAQMMRRKTGAERLQIADAMYRSARQMLLCYLRAEHPEWAEDAIVREAARRLSHGAV